MFIIVGPLYAGDEYLRGLYNQQHHSSSTRNNKYLSNVSLIIQNDCFEMVMLTTIVNIYVNCGGAGDQPYLMA